MRPGETTPRKNAQLLTRYRAIAAIDQDNNTRVLRHHFSVDPYNHAITGTSRVLTNGLQVAEAVSGQRLVGPLGKGHVSRKGAKKTRLATRSHNSLSFKTMYQKELARQVVAYLRHHPLSGDTLEGVSRWWLKQQPLTECVSDVHQAVVRLENEGLIYERATPDGRTLFFANLHAEKLDVVENGNDFEEGEIH